MRKIYLLTTATLCLLATALQAQFEKVPEVAPEPEKKERPDAFPSYDNKGAIAINAGSTGFGLEYAHNLNRHFNARFRANYFALNDFSRDITFDNNPITVIANVNVLNFDLLAEYLPFSKSSFKLVAGGSMFVNSDVTAQILYNDEFRYGDIVLTQEEIGDITIGLDYAGFAPYLGFGFGRAVPRKSVGFGIEVGMYYAGSPDVSLESTELFEPTAVEEKATLERNLSDYKWIPNLSMRLVFKL